ncbi:CDP-diacylglycerol diphosphatase [uncultured Aquitalea sp.]|uniref:CDP-diacylglycerol diphosphatase n=1 Tax=uncultured Aquitalea sp. TaxID=540272 RepID=UPI0025ED995E|nr:CDP-diacylglycerol diphosphatase [uncultured Aquitalea sp.]
MPVSRLLRFCVLAVLSLLLSVAVRADPDILWRIVSQQCVPHERQNGEPAPCAQVALPETPGGGWIVLKDIKGSLQYLLIPTDKVSGIESPALLNPDAPDYWTAAWEARNWMSRLRGSAVPREAVSLTVNSQSGRSQNQLHIHISCIKPELAAALTRAEAAVPVGQGWLPLPGGLNGHNYYAQRFAGDSLVGVRPFQRLAEGLPGALESMGDYTLAATAARFADGVEGFWLLADRADLLSGDHASAEDDVQDHGCAILQQPDTQ